MTAELPTKDDVVRSATSNHIWLNAFHCINPTKEYCEQIGRTVIEMVSRKDNLIPNYIELDGTESENTMDALRAMAKLTPVLYMSVNKS